ncbi:unnamed protein product, partial [Lampetra fluviatilis]
MSWVTFQAPGTRQREDDDDVDDDEEDDDDDEEDDGDEDGSTNLALRPALRPAPGQQTFRVRTRKQLCAGGHDGEPALRGAGRVWGRAVGQGRLLLGPQRDMPGFPRYSMGGTQASGQFNLQIESVELEDDGWFQCQAGRSPSSHPIASPTAWLSVLMTVGSVTAPFRPLHQSHPQRPVISDHVGSDSVTWVAGVEVTLTCTATDAKPRAQVQWMR